MALTLKQEQLILQGVSLGMRGRGQETSFLDILKENISEEDLVKVADAIKAEIISKKNAKKAKIEEEITELNS